MNPVGRQNLTGQQNLKSNKNSRRWMQQERMNQTLGRLKEESKSEGGRVVFRTAEINHRTANKWRLNFSVAEIFCWLDDTRRTC